MTTTPDTLLTVKEVAERLRIHPETVRNWLRDGRIRGRRMSDRMGWRVPASELERFIRAELLPVGEPPADETED